jgi:hypothetical protein
MGERGGPHHGGERRGHPMMGEGGVSPSTVWAAAVNAGRAGGVAQADVARWV